MTRWLKLALALIPFFFVAACGGSDDDDLDDRLDVADPKVRLVHAIPGAGEVSLFRDNVAQASEVTNVPYKGASNYFDVDSNSARWEVRTTTTPAVSIGDVEFEAERGDKYTLVAVPDAGDLTDLVLIRDPYDKGITSDKARIRVFNAAFNAGNVDVYLTEVAQAIDSVTPQFAGADFREAVPASGDDSRELEGGTYRLRVTTAGTKDVIFNAVVDLDENADWLLVPVPGDVGGGETLRVLVIKSDDGAPAVELVSE